MHVRVAGVAAAVVCIMPPIAAVGGVEGGGQAGRDADDSELVVAIRYKDETLAEAAPVLRIGARTYVALDPVAEALEFPIRWDPVQARATGWFIAPARRFDLDLAAAHVTCADASHALAQGDVLVRGGVLYVAIDALSRWLPITVTFDPATLALDIASREPLPMEQRRARAAARAALAAARSVETAPPTSAAAADANLEVTPVWPSAAATVRATWVKGRGVVHVATVQAAADVLGATASAYVGQTSLAGPTVTRLRLFRDDPDGQALGPRLSRFAPATRWEIGDVVSLDMPLGWRSAAGRGFSLTNAPMAQTIEFDRLTLQGEAPDGYDVELFRNGLLIDAIGDVRGGRYTFFSVPLELGANDLEVVLSGPQGQKIRRRQTTVIGPGALRPGEVRYALGALSPQQGAGNAALAGDVGWRGGARVEAGLTRATTIVAQVAGAADGAGPAQLYGAGVRRSLGPVYLRADVAGSSARAEATALGAVGRWRGVSFDLAATHFAADARLDPRRAAAGLARSVEGSATFGLGAGAQRMPISLAARRRVSVTGRVETGILARSSVRAGATALNAAFDIADVRDMAGARAMTVDAVIDASRRVGGVGLRLQAESDVARAAMRRVAATADVPTAGGAVRFGLETALRARVTTASVSYAWRIAGGELTLDASSDTSGRAAMIGVGLRVAAAGPAFGRGMAFGATEPERTGQIFARVYEDRDADGAFGPGDAPLAGVRVRAPGAGDDVETGTDGVARFTAAPAGQRTQVSLDLASLPDPFLAPLHAAYAARLRPGAAAWAEFPLAATADVEGAAVRNEGGGALPLEGVGVVVERLGGGAPQQVTTAFDGAYFLAGARPGRYRATLAPADAARLRLAAAPVEFIIDAAGATVRVPPLLAVAQKAQMSPPPPPPPPLDLADARDRPIGR